MCNMPICIFYEYSNQILKIPLEKYIVIFKHTFRYTYKAVAAYFYSRTTTSDNKCM